MRVLIADDQADVREALEHLVVSEPTFELVGVARDVDEAVELAKRYRPDVALVDVKMPDGGGPRATREIRACSPLTRVVALSAYDDRNSVFEMLRAGAVGYLVKGASAAEIHDAITRSARGDRVLSTAVTADVVHELAEQLEREAAAEEARRERMARVRQVLEEGRMTLAFQPIVELPDRGLVGLEALARFPDDPSQPPGSWFAEAAEVGLGVDLELAAVRLALEQLEQLPEEVFLAINAGPAALLTPAAGELLLAHDVARVVLETTEHAPVSDYDALRRALGEFRARGGRLAVDDAGAGFASLKHVLQLAPDIVKIDGSLVREIEADRGARAMTSALVTFAAEMGLMVIAEGVENESTLASLEDLGVRFAQGFHLGRPAPLEETGVVLRRSERLM